MTYEQMRLLFICILPGIGILVFGEILVHHLKPEPYPWPGWAVRLGCRVNPLPRVRARLHAPRMHRHREAV